MAIPISGLIGYYPFNGNANDESLTGNHGTAVNATLTADRYGDPDSAYYFNGVDAYIDLLSGFGGPTSGTVAAWVTVESYDLGYNMLNLIVGQADNFQLGLGDTSTGSDGLWVARLRAPGGFANAVGPSPDPLPTDWVHVATVWTGAELILYIDGMEESRVPPGTLTGAAGSMTFGMFAGKDYWHGNIDDVVIYDRALEPSEILELMAPEEPPPIPEPGTLALLGLGLAAIVRRRGWRWRH